MRGAVVVDVRLIRCARQKLAAGRLVGGRHGLRDLLALLFELASALLVALCWMAGRLARPETAGLQAGLAGAVGLDLSGDLAQGPDRETQKPFAKSMPFYLDIITLCVEAGLNLQGALASGTNVGAGNPLNVITGKKYQREVAMPALPDVLGLEIVRHYNSACSRPKQGNFWHGGHLPAKGIALGFRGCSAFHHAYRLGLPISL